MASKRTSVDGYKESYARTSSRVQVNDRRICRNFFKGDEDLGTSKYAHKIALSDDTPTKSRPYRVPYKQLKVVEEHLDQMLRMGVIRKSNRPWASSVVMIEKSDGSLRFCVDFRKANKKTIKDSNPMPLIDYKLIFLLHSGYGFWLLANADGRRIHREVGIHEAQRSLRILGDGVWYVQGPKELWIRPNKD